MEKLSRKEADAGQPAEIADRPAFCVALLFRNGQLCAVGEENIVYLRKINGTVIFRFLSSIFVPSFMTIQMK